MQDPKRTAVVLKQILIFLVLAFLTVYFRTYSLHGGPFAPLRSQVSIARQLVDQGIRAQIRSSLEKQFPQMPSFEAERITEIQARRIISEDRANYEGAVKSALSNISRARAGGGYHYLLEADPYYFLWQTEKLLEAGEIAEVCKGRRCLEPYRVAPKGYWNEILFHPYLGFFLYKIVHFFAPQAPLMETLGCLPVLLALLILPLYAWLGRVLRFSFLASVIGSAIISFSPIFLQRSALGWYDTDPYNFVFPIVVLIFTFLAVQSRKWFWIGILVASFVTGLYTRFWPGWAFMGILVPLSFFGGFLGLWLMERSMPADLAKTVLCLGGIYMLGWLISAAFFLSPGLLAESLARGWYAVNKFSLADFDLWPNIFLTVGEAGSIDLRKLIFLSGNYVTFAMAMAGLLWEGFYVFKRQDSRERFRFLFFLCLLVPILVMSLRTERFSVLFVLPLAIFASFFVTRFMEWAQSVFPKMVPGLAGKERWTRGIAGSLIVFVFAPLLLISAHVVARGIRPIMDDVWYEAMKEIKAKTPEDAIVDSWWPPGYFITAIAKRRVVIDGGTQHLHSTYWMSKVLMAEDEREAAGVLRMINFGGMIDAPDLLVKWGMEVPEAVELILKITRLSRTEALRALPVQWTSLQKETLLNLTHGLGELLPSYVLVYNDLVEQNLAVSIVANWDFKKARLLQAQKKISRGYKGMLERNSTYRYIRDMTQTSGKWLKYTPIASLSKREGSLLSFTNGLQVNLDTRDAMISLPEKGVRGAPSQLFYLEKGQLREKPFLTDAVDISALIFEDEGSFYSVLADAHLIRSLMFRLYYLRGQGLSLFKPVVSCGTLQGGTVVRVFELDRDKLREQDSEIKDQTIRYQK